MAETVTQGKVVSITYTLKGEDGKLFEYRDVPVSYLHGSGSDLFPKVEQALIGKSVGDRVNVVLSPDEGFGERDPNLQFKNALFDVPEDYRRIGAEIEARNEVGESRTFFVTQIEDGTVTFDANHPLVGQTVEFIVRIVGIRQASDQELQRGTPDADPGLPFLM